MKKLFFIPLLIFAFFSVNAKDLSDFDYVITKNNTYFCQQISLGLLKTKCILENGEVLKINLSDILAYKIKGKIYERMTVYEGNKSTGKTALMELISIRDGMKLFRHSEVERNETLCSKYNEFYVFKNGEYVLQLCNKSCKQVFDYFNVSMKG